MLTFKGAWRWRGGVGVVLLVAAMVGFRLGGGGGGGGQISAKMAEVRGRGEPVELKDFSHPKVKQEENAWPIWIKAINAINPSVDPPRSSNLEFDAPPYPPAWMMMAAASEKAHGPVFAAAREARSRAVTQFRKELPAPMNVWLPYLNSVKMLVNLLS